MDEVDLSRRGILTMLAALPTGGNWIWQGPIRPADATSPAGPAGQPATAAEARAGRQPGGPGPIARIVVHNRASSPAESPMVVFAHAFAPGDIAAGARVELRGDDGTSAYLTQQDFDSTWKQAGHIGALRMGSISARLKGLTIAPDGSATLQVWSRNAAPERAGVVSLAQVHAGSDFKIRFSGGNLGADVFEASFNAITGTGSAQRDRTRLWGSKPAQGWQRTRSGPNCVEYEAWEYPRRVSDGARHKWLKATFTVRARSATEYEVFAQAHVGALAGPGPGSVGPAKPDRILCEAVLLNGSQRVHAVGGPDDPRVRAVQSIDVKDNRVHLGSDELHHEMGVPLRLTSSGGSLPGGISDGAVYFARKAVSPGGYCLFKSLKDMGEFKNIVDIADEGSGRCTAVPMAMIQHSAGLYFCTAEGDAIAVGFDRPSLMVETDFAYLSQQTRCVSPYDTSLGPTIAGRARSWKYSANAAVWTGQYQGINGTGDGADDDRIGWLSHTEVCALMRQAEPSWRQRVKMLALAWAATGKQYWDDETTGTLPNFNAQSYPGMPSRAGHRVHHRNEAQIYPSGDQGALGAWGYGEEIDGSHLPGFWYGAYLMTGERWFIQIGLAQVNALHGACDKTSDSTGMKGVYQSPYVNYPPSSQARGIGWALARAFQLHCLMPDDHTHAHYVRDLIGKHLDCGKAYMDGPASAAQKALGYLTLHDRGAPGGAWNVQTFGTNFYAWALGMLRWIDEFPVAHALWNDHYRKWTADYVDERAGGCLWTANIFYSTVSEPGGKVFATSFKQLNDMHFRVNDGSDRAYRYSGPLPFACPADGIGYSKDINGSSSDPNCFSAARASALACHAMAGDRRAGALAAASQARSNFRFSGHPKYAVKYVAS